MLLLVNRQPLDILISQVAAACPIKMSYHASPPEAFSDDPDFRLSNAIGTKLFQ